MLCQVVCYDSHIYTLSDDEENSLHYAAGFTVRSVWKILRAAFEYGMTGSHSKTHTFLDINVNF